MFAGIPHKIDEVLVLISQNFSGSGNLWFAGDWVAGIGHNDAIMSGLAAARGAGIVHNEGEEEKERFWKLYPRLREEKDRRTKMRGLWHDLKDGPISPPW